MVTAVKAPRISGTGMAEPVSAARDWVAGHRADFQRLVDSLRGDVAINAAGLAAPASGDAAGLRGANAVWPAVMSLACREAAVPRLVHLSSAAVQGRREPLDESTEHEPFSRYTRSKAEGEDALLRLGEAGGVSASSSSTAPPRCRGRAGGRRPPWSGCRACVNCR